MGLNRFAHKGEHSKNKTGKLTDALHFSQVLLNQVIKWSSTTLEYLITINRRMNFKQHFLAKNKFVYHV